MKITNVEAFPVWGGGRNFCFVTIDTDEGISGVGETGIGGREDAVVGLVNHFKPLLTDQNPMRTEHISQVLYRSGFFPATHLAASVIAAIDIALWDIKGKALGVPVYDLLGGLSRDKVVCYPHNSGGHGMDPAPLALQGCPIARHWIDSAARGASLTASPRVRRFGRRWSWPHHSSAVSSQPREPAVALPRWHRLDRRGYGLGGRRRAESGQPLNFA
jgi:L-alanine-DL-glutamate epimerase-like enolase superfamily enzyme